MSDQQSTKSILLEAVRLENPADRRQYLESACGADTQRLKRIANWLENGQHQQNNPLDVAVSQLHFTNRLHASGATDSGQSVPGKELESPPDDLCGARIGPYEIVEQLGQGGMGEVFLARQTSPINRKVALKLTNLGALSIQLAAHIEAERRALELMDHPGIARVLDAGTTAWGTPYFVLELVSGQRITD